jgi:hypothetical protein
MDSTHTDATNLIANYLAGRLSANQMDSFEQDVSRDPRIRDQLERTLKLKEGLARLREHGELDDLLRAPAPRRWSLYAAAASVAFASLAVALWLQVRSPGPSILLLSPSSSAQEHAPLAGTYTLARTRASTGATEVRLPSKAGLIRLRVVPSADAVAQPGHTLVLQRVDTQPVRLMGRLDAGAPGPDGYLTVYVDAGRLAPGIYELSVTPTVPEGSSAPSDRFVLQVQ